MVSFIAERESKLKQFISKHFNNEPHKVDLMPGDAGMRSYYRISTAEKTFVVMDCPPSYSKVNDFAKIAKFLTDNDFSAPKIYDMDQENGYLLLEDFGTLGLTKFLELNPETKDETYKLIIDLLISLTEKDCPEGLSSFDNALLCKEVEIFADQYIPYAYYRELKMHEFDEFIDLWQDVLSEMPLVPNAIVLRDYHLDNMMYLEDRDSLKKIGLLDFQDARYGSVVYDLVSVLEDARFEVSRSDALSMIDYFIDKKGLNKESVLAQYHILGAQRNMRILGVFVRKFTRDNDKNYIKYIPRVKQYLDYDLSYPALGKIKVWLDKLR
jgi:aminoglycoside/choline kinase family phosphotransferase